MRLSPWNRIHYAAAGAAAVAALWLTTRPARADLTFCNNTPAPLNTALGWLQDSTWRSKGWYVINPGECKLVLSGDLNNRYYYDYAVSATDSTKIWRGEHMMCTSSAAFEIPVGAECSLPDMDARAFEEIDVGDAASFTLSLTCNDCVDPRARGVVASVLPILEQVANQQVPVILDQTGAWTDVGDDWVIKYAITRAPFHASLSGSTISVAVRANYAVTLGRRIGKPFPLSGSFVRPIASCGVGEDPREVDIAISTTFWLEADGSLRSRSRVSNMSFLNSCLATMANIDVTPRIRSFLSDRLDQLCGKLDERIRSTALQVTTDAP